MSNRYTTGKFGIVSEVKKGFARVEFTEDEIVSNWLPVCVKRSLTDKESWPFEVQEHVFCMMDENCEYGIILGALYSEADEPDPDEGAGKFRKLFEDGSFIEYNKNTHILTANIQGKIKAIATDDIEITTDADIKATAAGDIVADATGNITATAVGDITADAVNIEATGSAKISATAPVIEATAATSATVIAPAIALTGVVTITGATTIVGALIASSIGTTGGGAITADGNLVATGNISTSAGDVIAGTIALKTHKHLGVTVGGGTSGLPTP